VQRENTQNSGEEERKKKEEKKKTSHRAYSCCGREEDVSRSLILHFGLICDRLIQTLNVSLQFEFDLRNRRSEFLDETLLHFECIVQYHMFKNLREQWWNKMTDIKNGKRGQGRRENEQRGVTYSYDSRDSLLQFQIPLKHKL
jgi:hypothetical protein